MMGFRMSRQQHYTSNAPDCAYIRATSLGVRLWQRVPRKIDGEDTPRARNVADTENSIIRLDATPTDCEPESEPGFVGAALRKWQEHVLCTAWWQTTAMILDVDQDAIRDCIGVHRDLSARCRELERVLQQVSKCREKHVGVDINRKAILDIGYNKFAPSGTRLQQCGDPDLIHELRKGDELVPRRHPGGDSHVGKGPIYQRTQSDQGTLQHPSGCPGHPDITRFDGSEGESGGMNEVPQLMREKSQPFVQRLNVIVRPDRIALVGIFRDSLGDAVVETAVERSKFVYFDRRLAFKCQIRDGLTQIAVVVNDLLHRKSLLQQLASV